MQKSRLLFLAALTLVIFSLIFSLSKGSTSLSVYQLLFTENAEYYPIFLELRLSRTLSAFVCGGLLALAGVLMQVLLENPLADPYILGTSGGAALLTLCMMLLGASEWGILGGAWAGSLLSMLFILLLAKKHGFQPQALLLAGITLAFGFGAAISFILVLTPDSNLHNMLFWLTGDLNGAAFPWWGLCVLSVGLMLCLLLARGLNILSRGEKEARALGVSTKKYRMMLYFLSSLFTASAVTIGGTIAFIGLIIPHLVRFIAGHNHSVVLPLAVCLGGSLLVLADTAARSLFAPMQVPVGVFVALICIPAFIWMMQK